MCDEVNFFVQTSNYKIKVNDRMNYVVEYIKKNKMLVL